VIVGPGRTHFFLSNPRIRTDFFVQPEAKLINCATQTSLDRVILFLFESTLNSLQNDIILVKYLYNTRKL